MKKIKHFGDITKLSADTLPPVDCITGGSPCQDLSVAGKRAGLAGKRSGLFMEQMRIVREMREHDRNTGRTGAAIRPRFMVWENVPGAFSSGTPKGSDFAAVIEEILKVCEPGAFVHVCVPDRGWPKCGCYYADNGTWSIAWRVHDAKFWGVPQRRKRIALVADFGGLTAPEVLFERKGMSWDLNQGAQARKETTGESGDGTAGTVWCVKGNAIDRDTAQNGRWENADISFSLDATDRHGVVAGFKHKAASSARGVGFELECGPTLSAGQTSAVYDARGNGSGDICPTITGDHQNRVTDYTALCVGNGQLHNISMSEQANTLDTMHDQQIVFSPPVSHTLKAKGNSAHREDSETYVVAPAVRRLTPLECERLQGYPDEWTNIGEWTDSNGKKRQTTDTARYKALGNSIALPFWFWLLRRISAQYERPATLGSLFDGIGGFPFCWERCNGIGTALWASEIEEFPIAVTKERFPDN